MPDWMPYVMIGVAAGLVLMLSKLRSRGATQLGEQLSPSEKAERQRQTDGVRGDLRQMMRELEELTQRFGDELEAKSSKLEKLLREANTKIAELEKLRTAKPASPRLIPAKAIEVEIGEPVDPVTSKIYEMSDGGRTSIEIAKQLQEQVGKVELILALRQQK